MKGIRYGPNGEVEHFEMRDLPPTVVSATPKPCVHGHDLYSECTVDEAELTSCCGVNYTFSGDGDPYCRCCHGSVIDGASGIECANQCGGIAPSLEDEICDDCARAVYDEARS